MITPADIISCLNNYLDDEVGGPDLIDLVDEAVSSDAVYDYDDQIQAVVMKYQDLLALYVDDPANRAESRAFYGPDRLKAITSDFKDELEALGCK